MDENKRKIEGKTICTHYNHEDPFIFPVFSLFFFFKDQTMVFAKKVNYKVWYNKQKQILDFTNGNKMVEGKSWKRGEIKLGLWIKKQS